MSTFAICRCCNLVQQQIQILQWKSRFSNGCVIHVKESVVFLVLSANVPALWAPVRKPVLFWPSWCGCSNGTTNPKKQYHYNVMHCWCWMITRSSPSHDYILRIFFFCPPTISCSFHSRAWHVQEAVPDTARHLWIRLEWSAGPLCHYRSMFMKRLCEHWLEKWSESWSSDKISFISAGQGFFQET